MSYGKGNKYARSNLKMKSAREKKKKEKDIDGDQLLSGHVSSKGLELLFNIILNRDRNFMGTDRYTKREEGDDIGIGMPSFKVAKEHRSDKKK